MSVPLAHEPDCILSRVLHVTACAGARVSKKWVIHLKVKSWLRPLEFTVPYLKINFISCFLLYSWLARPAFNKQPSCPPVYDWLSWSGQVRQVISPVDDNFRCSLKRSANLCSFSPMYTIDGHLVHGETRHPTSSSASRFAHKAKVVVFFSATEVFTRSKVINAFKR